MWPTVTGDAASSVNGSLFTSVGPEPIDPSLLYTRTRQNSTGAVVQFCGTVRNHNQSARVAALEYEAYPEMARAELDRIVAAARERWACDAIAVVHRTGALEIGDIAVCVTVAAPHREEAFAACRFVIDRTKEAAPIWKRETLVSGSRRWVEEEPPIVPRPESDNGS